MTERDYAIRSFKEITLNAARHTEERMDLYYEKMKALMNNYQDLILENQLVLDELEQECQEKINENMAYALQYMDAYDYRMNLGKLKKEVNNIIQALGIRFGVDGEDSKEANIDKLRYKKVIIMTDADVDGSHIDTLIMTLFFRYFPQVIQQGYLYIATPPLYLCTKGKVKEYCWTDQQRQKFIDTYGGGSENAVHTQRYKGLGEMNPEQLWETTMNPENRMLKQVHLENAAEADYTFSMLMGEDVGPRRDFIEKNATYANIDA